MPEGGTSVAHLAQSPGVMTRVGQAARYVISAITPNTWMSPLQPLLPLATGAENRAFDYQVGYNINYIPRTGHAVTFGELHQLGRACEIARLCIETRKDQLSALSWNIGFKDPAKHKENDAGIDEITEFFQSPDKIHDFHDWLRPIIEELLVTDAVTIYRRKTKGGDLYSLEQISGATIKPLIDDTGRRPVAPSPAYQQILKGVPACDYSAEELFYAPRNLRVESPYGYSPLEQMIVYAKQQIERSASQLYYFTIGSLPDGFLTAPKTFTPDQIASFDKKLNALLSGNLGVRRQLSVMPEGTTFNEVKQPLLKDEFDEWLARIACYAFSLPPTPFIKQMNRSTSETSQDAAKDEGLAPLLLWVKRKIDLFIAIDLKRPDLCFTWDLQSELDPETQANIDKILVSACIKSVNEVRLRRGDDPVKGGEEPMLATATGWAGLPGSDVEAQQDQRAKDNMPEPAPPAQPNPKNIDSSQPEKKPNAKMGKAVRHTPLPFDHATLAKAEKAIKKAALAALKRALRSTLDHVEQHLELGKLAKADEEPPKKTPEQIAADVAEIDETASGIAASVDLSALKITVEIVPELTSIAEESAANAIAAIGVGGADVLTEVNTRAAAWAEGHAADLVSDITETTRNKIQSTITEALTDGWAQDELILALKHDYAFSKDRAELIANTETNNANNQGALQGGHLMADKGIHVKKKWLDAAEPCDVCTINAEEGWIELDEEFTSGHQCPTAHPRCLCALMILAADDIAAL